MYYTRFRDEPKNTERYIKVECKGLEHPEIWVSRVSENKSPTDT